MQKENYVSLFLTKRTCKTKYCVNNNIRVCNKVIFEERRIFVVCVKNLSRNFISAVKYGFRIRFKFQIDMHEIFAEDDIPTKSELQRQLGVSLAQVLVDYSHDDVKNLLRSSVRPFGATPRDDRSDIDETWPQKVLKSHVHHDVLGASDNNIFTT